MKLCSRCSAELGLGRRMLGHKVCESSISIDVPDGTRVSIKGVEGASVEADASAPSATDLIEKYWDDYLSDNGRKVFETAARIEDVHGPGYTLEDIAHTLSIDYESVKSMHRSTGRTAKRWRRDEGTDVPIELLWQDYSWDDSRNGHRTEYYLPPGVADAILR